MKSASDRSEEVEADAATGADGATTGADGAAAGADAGPSEDVQHFRIPAHRIAALRNSALWMNRLGMLAAAAPLMLALGGGA